MTSTAIVSLPVGAARWRHRQWLRAGADAGAQHTDNRPIDRFVAEKLPHVHDRS
jgi:hypothetical protein